ncbi:MAG: DUF948 domain-containing protein [Ignavibacteriaceae bacterium]|nr:DUF948 domain-containing protein [Ignavibacteriaceae bacterium]
MIIEIMEVILLISASALCIFLIYFLYQLTGSIRLIQQEIQAITAQVGPLVDSIKSLSVSVNELTKDLRQQISKINWIVDEIKSKIELLQNIESKVVKGVEAPVSTLMSNLNALKAGLAAFFNRMKK